ncbi:MAG: hypothetical protein LKK36_09340 [Ewingella americana]|jgi:hypothetical protein|uniref:hypothetical protein n=1 Tax=Ewingella americana TaxID=41202 RepID=UPI0024312E18|nr:hypothetical protein [Ewingella americana]MCI1680468.1 hypothetical protein [Ewingella americana]MCI1856318.1 hypothetical protein [Ewingella americana]MCI1863965.1 hypothetical protein [Ewingella americana]MCI2142997.1 hypothetical protein [Ewingella americana]MCI2163882.1 hypothetical protein [Ewingella americana]
MRKDIPLGEAMCRIQQAESVLSLWLGTMTTDDGDAPDLIASVLTLLDGLPDVISRSMEAK